MTPKKTNSDAQYKAVRLFLSKLSDEHFNYLELQLAMAKNARKLVSEFNLSKEKFCQLIQITSRDYNKFLNGGFNYDLKKMALIHLAFEKLHSEKIKIKLEKELVSVAK